MIDHIGIEVSNYQKAIQFYQQTLAPLGYTLLMEVQGFAGFGSPDGKGPIANFWLYQGNNPTNKAHIAFTANNRKVIDAFFIKLHLK